MATKIKKAKLIADDEEAAFLAAVKEGIADLDAGRSIPYVEVRRWLLPWGTENELPPPECPE
jgi:predicted transcriptional regulator